MQIKEIVFLTCFLVSIPIFFKLLRCLEIEKYFKKGHTVEIKVAYILFSIILAELLTAGIERIFSFNV